MATVGLRVNYSVEHTGASKDSWHYLKVSNEALQSLCDFIGGIRKQSGGARINSVILEDFAQDPGELPTRLGAREVK